MSISVELAKLLVKLVGETAEFDEKIVESAKKATKVGEDMTKAGMKMTTGVTLPLIAAGTASVAFASDLEESRNKALVVFDTMGQSMLNFADNSATAYGMSEEAALSYASTYGSLLKNVGMMPEAVAEWSKKLVQLTSDYASFHNLKPEEAFEKIRAGLVGSSEPLLSLGKDLRVAQVEAYALANGLTDGSEAMDMLTTTQARLGTLFAQSNDEWGDFARTSDGVANSSRIVMAEMQDLAATFGQDLIPMVKDALGILKPMLETFNDLPEPTRQFIIALGGAAAISGPLLTGIGGITTMAGKLATNLGAVASSGGTAALTSMVNPAAAVALALTTTATAAVMIANTSKEVKEGTEGVADAFADVLSEAEGAEDIYNEWAAGLERVNKEYKEEQSLAKLFIPMKKIQTDSVKALSDSLIASGVPYSEYKRYMDEAIMSSGVLTQAVVDSRDVVADQDAWLLRVGERFGFVSEEMYNAAAQTSFLAEIQQNELVTMQEFGLAAAATADDVEALKVQQENAAVAAEQLAAAQAEAKTRADETAQSFSDLAASLKGAAIGQIAQTELGLLNQMFQDGQIDRATYLTATQEIGTAFGIMDEKSLALAGNLPILNQLLEEGVLPADELDTALGLLNDEAKDGVVDWENLISQLELAPDDYKAIQESVTDLYTQNGDLILSNDQLMASYATFKAWADENVITIQINEVIERQYVTPYSSGYAPSNNTGLPWEERANGGIVYGGVPYSINEYGPNEVLVSQDNGYVLNRNDALNALGKRDPVGNGEILAALQSLPTRIADELAVR